MAIPIIIATGIGATAGLGVLKTSKAFSNNKQANQLSSDAESIIQTAQTHLENSRLSCEESLTTLGGMKLKIYQVNIKKFIDLINQIKDVDFEQSSSNLPQTPKFDDVAMTEIKKQLSVILHSGLGLGGGALAGGLTAFGAYSGTMAFATAGTGTAISSLNGIAATNATLAWLGGGPLALGGMGITGGTIALSALTTGPLFLVASWYVESKTETKLNTAKTNKAQAEEFSENCKAAQALTDKITELAEQGSENLSLLRKHFRRNLNLLENVITRSGTDYATYTADEQKLVLRCIKIMQVIKAIIDTPILDQEGNLLGDAEANLHALHQEVQSQFAPVEQS